MLVVVGQTVEKADERLLHHVLAGGPVTQAPLHKGEQPALVAGNQGLPGAGIALADLLDEQAVTVRRHRVCLFWSAASIAALVFLWRRDGSSAGRWEEKEKPKRRCSPHSKA